MIQYTNVPINAPMTPPKIIKNIKELASEGRDSLILFIIRKLVPIPIKDVTSIINRGYLKLTSVFNFSLKNKMGLNNKVFIYFPLIVSII
jgi:hypothetical protein